MPAEGGGDMTCNIEAQPQLLIDVVSMSQRCSISVSPVNLTLPAADYSVRFASARLG